MMKTEMNIVEVTKILRDRVEHGLDKEKYHIRLEEWSWCSDIIICNHNLVQLQSFFINRFDESGQFGIGIPDYDRIDYLARGMLDGDLNSVVDEFIEKFNSHQDYMIARKKEEVCNYESLKFKDSHKNTLLNNRCL